MSTFPVKELNGPYGEQIGAEEWLERPDHPLLNHLILEKLFVYVRRYDLKACRGVCKKWNVLTIPHMRSAHRVVIYRSQSIPVVEEETRSRQIDNFVKLFKENQLGIPFSKFQLGPFCTTDGVGLEFLQLCGQTITEVELDDPKHFGRDSEVHKIEHISALLTSTPNIRLLALPYKFVSRSRNTVKLFSDSTPKLSFLKKLTIGIYDDSSKEWVKYCPTYTEELFTAAPNISEIRIFNFTNIDDREDFDLGSEESSTTVILGGQEVTKDINTALLNIIEKFGNQSSIESFHLDFATIADVNQIKRMGEKENGLKLKSLSFSPDWSRLDLDFQECDIQLVKLFEDTLRFLNIEDHPVWATTLAEFPRMSNLKFLNLSILWNTDSVQIEMNKHFPILDTLEIYFMEDSCVEEWEDCLTNFEPCQTVKSLILRTIPLKLRAFHDILRVFPTLTKLDLNIGENGGDILRGIWTEMTQLVSLSIRSQINPKENLDSIFTGIPTDVLNEIRPIVNGLDKMSTELRRYAISKLMDQYCEQPSIRNLTNLKHLNLIETSCPRKVVLNELVSDVTGFLALYSMGHLRQLKINWCGRGVFTKT